ncbi:MULTISPECIES: plasmid partitioning protein RepB [Rhodobacterales]|jgi:ParB family transcriptional regulator, chromosome partitioning protein|uniref:Rep B partitioning protein/ParB n=1 Tax=Roseovarius atlanticus TaxID=1641875 RepID=A0A0T5NNX3_9RHOB|nr:MULTISPECIES: plasmid partitioning protein RepB [Rhodobacterales]KRS10676.1 Rep B partitioning protein/ParB [Roseovarius atlanticus]MBO9447853.1 plasmid partitioning protein RepB [Ruegeria sp. R14_0]MBS8224714.1 plasmid partitioning protein RepB [Vannielia litorea]OAO03659.1 plasmid partitioning protein RepB [Roseovarius indicus]|tara:strand:+ start:1630 stop:2646 length:1017 start_codon:yes stop_codon:yes gene_type:complete
MTSGKKKRMSMLDSLAAAGAPSPAPQTGAVTPMMTSNRALRSARDAVDSHHVWELDPASIEDGRMADRLDPADVMDLRDAIEANGQTVPILVRRAPGEDDRYLLVYGRRRLEAIRQSDKVTKVRALVTNLDDDSALRAQISENMGRRDLSFIEKALFAKDLVSSGFGNQSQVAEILTVTKSSISMAIAIADMVGPDLVRAIGAAHGIGRPRWESLGRAIDENGLDREDLIGIAKEARENAETSMVVDDIASTNDPSIQTFLAVEKAVTKAIKPAKSPSPAPPSSVPLKIGGKRGGTVKRTAKGLSIELADGDFADWVETQVHDMIEDLHERWKQRSED